MATTQYDAMARQLAGDASAVVAMLLAPSFAGLHSSLLQRATIRLAPSFVCWDRVIAKLAVAPDVSTRAVRRLVQLALDDEPTARLLARFLAQGELGTMAVTYMLCDVARQACNQQAWRRILVRLSQARPGSLQQCLEARPWHAQGSAKPPPCTDDQWHDFWLPILCEHQAVARTGRMPPLSDSFVLKLLRPTALAGDSPDTAAAAAAAAAATSDSLDAAAAAADWGDRLPLREGASMLLSPSSLAAASPRTFVAAAAQHARRLLGRGDPAGMGRAAEEMACIQDLAASDLGLFLRVSRGTPVTLMRYVLIGPCPLYSWPACCLLGNGLAGLVDRLHFLYSLEILPFPCISLQ